MAFAIQLWYEFYMFKPLLNILDAITRSDAEMKGILAAITNFSIFLYHRQLMCACSFVLASYHGVYCKGLLN